MTNNQFSINTANSREFKDLTPEIATWLQTTGAKDGMVLVRTLHTTTAVFINENERGFLVDLEAMLQKIAPAGQAYLHDDFSQRDNIPADEPINGHAHLQASLLGSQVMVPVKDGKLALGKWQTIMFAELDGPRQNRTIEYILIS